jgi:hypothetical protein
VGEGGVVLILDLDTTSLTPQILQKVIDQYKLSVVLVGARNVTPFLAMGIKFQITKPAVDSGFMYRLFFAYCY